MTVAVRPARLDELDAVGDLTVAAYEEYLVPEDFYVARLRDTVARHAQAELYVATLDGALAGTVTYCPEGSPWREVGEEGEGEFRMLGVHPSARRRGVADALVGLCLERSRELGHHALALCSLPEQVAAHRLYERLGFRRVPDRDWSPTDEVHLLAFLLPL